MLTLHLPIRRLKPRAQRHHPFASSEDSDKQSKQGQRKSRQDTEGSEEQGMCIEGAPEKGEPR